jgi:hypothetical protein
MNDYNAMNDYNGMNEELVKGPVEPTQTVEPKQEEIIEFHEQAITMNDSNPVNEEQVTEPVEPMQTVESRQEEIIEFHEQATTPKAMESEPLPWLSGEEIDELKSRWNSIQIKFVDEPHTAVEQADALVAEALERIKQVFSNKRTILNEQWINHQDISTEDLRISLQSYRSFLNRILAL